MSEEVTNNDVLKAFEEFKTANDERLAQIEAKGSADPLTEAKTDAINADITKLTAKLAEVEKKAARPSTGDATNTDEHSELFNQWMRKGRNDSELAEFEAKAMNTTSDAGNDGGHTVPKLIDSNIIRVLSKTSVIRSLANVETVSSGDYSKLVNEAGTGAGWVAEAAARGETSTPKVKLIKINMGEVYANPAVTQRILDDSMFDVDAFIANEVATKFAEMEGDAFVNGDGVDKPLGLMHANSGILNAEGALTGDALISLVYGLKAGYRTGAAFVANTLFHSEVRKLKDENGNYMWKAGLADGQPATILGYAAYEDENVADGDAIFGQFSNYTIVDRTGINMIRDPYTQKGSVLFYSTKRVGGRVTMADAFRTFTIGA